MMAGNTAGKAVTLSDTQPVVGDPGRLLTRKLWIPKVLYAALPLFYLLSGFAALFATLYISDWFWVLPHYLLFSLACMHMGVLVYRRRRRRSS